MAVQTPNALLPLAVRTARPVSAFQASERQGIANRATEAGITESGRRVQAFDAAADDRQNQAETIERFRNVEAGVKKLSPLLNQVIAGQDPSQFMAGLEERRTQLIADGRPTEDTDLAIQTAQSGNFGGVRQLFDQVLENGQRLDAQGLGVKFDRADQGSGLTSELQTFEGLSEAGDLSPEERVQAAKVNLGILARAGTTTGEERAAADRELAEALAEVDELREAAKETGKLSAQLQLKPEVDAAVKTAVARATLSANEATTNRSNERALQIYDVAIKGLSESLGETVTGPISGLMPAITANQQIADGAVAAIAPVLKQLFRAAGEGIFTDKDQELLLQMVPTRSDLPEARAAKLVNIDAIVRAKLAPLTPIEETAQDSQVLRFDAAGNRVE